MGLRSEVAKMTVGQDEALGHRRQQDMGIEAMGKGL